MIKLTAIGHLGKDATVNNVNGKNVINFSVAHTEKWKDAQGAQQEKTVWIDCAYWTDKTAISPYLLKGTQVYVEGIPEVRTYQTQDGSTKATQSLRISSVQLLGGGKKEGPTASQQQAPAAQNTGFEPVQTEHNDLPF